MSATSGLVRFVICVSSVSLGACTVGATPSSNPRAASITGAPASGAPAQSAAPSSGGSPSLSTSPSPRQRAGKTSYFAAGMKTYTFVDRSRTVAASHTTTGNPGPRVLRTFVWYPAVRSGGANVRPSPAPGGPFPLVVFASGYNANPTDYQRLLESWVHAGYVVAAPAFPLTNPRAVGGLDEADISNQPQDVSFVLTQLLRTFRSSGPMHSLIDPAHIAVAGQSDGAEVALAVAYGKCCADPRFDAAIIMAGQLLPFEGTLFKSPAAPLLVIQGGADTVNPPQYSHQIYQAASSPKYLLWLQGADHVQPFMSSDHYESTVSSVSLEFLNRYLGNDPRAAVGLPPSVSRDAALRSAPKGSA